MRTRCLRIDRIRPKITLRGPLDEEQRARLLEFAAKCPVHRTLTGAPRIVDAAIPAA